MHQSTNVSISPSGTHVVDMDNSFIDPKLNIKLQLRARLDPCHLTALLPYCLIALLLYCLTVGFNVLHGTTGSCLSASTTRSTLCADVT
jgi:hypothetical protein